VNVRSVSVPLAKSASLIAQLERDLRDVWASSGDPDAPPITRVCTMNLEVVAPSAELIERYTPVVDEVTSAIPARAILASVEPGASVDELSGDATAVCTPSGEGKICSERINLACRGRAAARAASAIEAFLLPELPTTLVWLGPVRGDDPVFEDLSLDASRIILDSEYTSIASLLRIVAWARTRRNAPDIADLAWTRIAVWQELLARFFDDEGALPLATRITRIGLTETDGPGAGLGTESALMLGWIGTRLGYCARRDGDTLRMSRADGASVHVDLRTVARPKGVAPHTLARLAIEAGDDAARPALSGEVERDLASGLTDQAGTTPDADVLCWRSTRRGGATTEQRLRLGANKAAKWLERTLRRPSRDAAFDESVAFAEQIVEVSPVSS
jgi:glucose-6-phosphate dehydrogenase assembly protein OpcA